MKPITKKVFTDLLVSPWLIPFAIGFTAFMYGWVISNGLLKFGGFVGIVAGCAMLVSRFLNSFGKIVEKAGEYMVVKDAKDKKQFLDNLSVSLNALSNVKYVPDSGGKEKVYKPVQVFNDLRLLMDNFYDSVKKGKISKYTADGVGPNIEALFEGCVGQMQHARDVWTKASRMSKSNVQATLLTDYGQTIVQIVLSSEQIAQVIQECSQPITEQNGTTTEKSTVGSLEMKRLELERSLKIAKKVQDRMRQIGQEEKV